MKLKRIVKGAWRVFVEKSDRLDGKWWHRLFIVLYGIILFFVFILSFGGSYVALDKSDYFKNTSNVNVVSDLRSFAKDYSGNGVVVEDFLLVEGSLGCVDEQKNVSYLSSYNFASKTYCDPNMRGNIEKAASWFARSQSYGFATIKKGLEETLDKDTEYRYCFIPKDIGCTASNKIIKYSLAPIYYLKIIALSLLISLIVFYYLYL